MLVRFIAVFAAFLLLLLAGCTSQPSADQIRAETMRECKRIVKPVAQRGAQVGCLVGCAEMLREMELSGGCREPSDKQTRMLIHQHCSVKCMEFIQGKGNAQ